VPDPITREESVPGEGFTPRHIKDAALELLKYGLLESASKPNLYRAAVAGNRDITRIFEPLDLVMKIDELRGIAYVAVATPAAEVDDEWSHPLIRRQRMNLEQSLLVAILRQQFVVHEQEAGLGGGTASVAIEDLLPQLQMYLGNLGSDAQEQKRLRGLLDQLKGYGLVSEVDAHDEVQLRPIIAHLANPANLTNLLHAFRDASRLAPTPPSPAVDES
jgi:hypothetical protein